MMLALYGYLSGCAVLIYIIIWTARFVGGGWHWTQNVCFDSLYNCFSEVFLIVGLVKRDIIINVHKSSRKVPVILVIF